MDMLESTVSQRLQQLRQLMREHSLEAYALTTSDPHLSEYLPEHWQTLKWLTGFTGSLGQALVTEQFAGLWVDSRYWEQAAREVAGTGWTVMRVGSSDPFSTLTDWFTQLPAQSRVGMDTRVLSCASVKKIQQACLQANLQFQDTEDLCASIWCDRPPIPGQPIFAHPLHFAGETTATKIEQLRMKMREHSVDWHLISSLDDIAWLMNLRGSDIAHNPVFLSYCAIHAQQVILFIQEECIHSADKALLAQQGVQIQSYKSFVEFISTLSKQSVWIDPVRTSFYVYNILSTHNPCREETNPSVFYKSQKNGTQLSLLRETMREDGIALCYFFAWLEKRLKKTPALTEWEIDAEITRFRQERKHFITTSFATIAGFNANGAQPHYQAKEEHSAVIEGQGLLLIDSGGQYFGGTTDITRVVPVGEPTLEQKADYTLVLKGLIALSTAHFPKGIASPLLDAIARAPLWKAHIDYGHGTGHGVGYCLNVHEGPQSFSFRTPPSPANAMQPGMVTSIEPGIYRPGQWGIRIENLVATVPAELTQLEYLQFDTLTLCPIDTRCIRLDLLNSEERIWLNQYHKRVRDTLAPFIVGDTLDWLLERTEAI